MATDTKFETRSDHRGLEGVPLRGRWRVLSERSRVGFRVKRMGLYGVKGRFRAVGGKVELGPARSSADVAIDAASIAPRIPPRNMHLRSADFLDVRHHPTITVRADSVELGSGGALRGPATFEIHGQRAEVELSGHYRGGARELLVLHLSGSPDRHGFRTRPRQPVEMIVGGGWS